MTCARSQPRLPGRQQQCEDEMKRWATSKEQPPSWAALVCALTHMHRVGAECWVFTSGLPNHHDLFWAHFPPVLEGLRGCRSLEKSTWVPVWTVSGLSQLWRILVEMHLLSYAFSAEGTHGHPYSCPHFQGWPSSVSTPRTLPTLWKNSKRTVVGRDTAA